MGKFLSDYPAVIIMEAPGTLTNGKHKYRCMICTNLFHITDRGYDTVRDLRRTRHSYVITCHRCHLDLRPLLPNGKFTATDVEDSRRLMGL